MGCAFVEGHDDVRSQSLFDFHDFFGSEKVFRAVKVGTEFHTVLADFDDGIFAGMFFPGSERKYLVPAGVGEDGLIPVHPCVKPPHFFDEFVAGAKVKMIGVGEDDLCSHGFDFIRT